MYAAGAWVGESKTLEQTVGWAAQQVPCQAMPCHAMPSHAKPATNLLDARVLKYKRAGRASCHASCEWTSITCICPCLHNMWGSPTCWMGTMAVSLLPVPAACAEANARGAPAAIHAAPGISCLETRGNKQIHGYAKPHSRSAGTWCDSQILSVLSVTGLMYGYHAWKDALRASVCLHKIYLFWLQG